MPKSLAQILAEKNEKKKNKAERKPPIFDPIEGIIWGIYSVTCLLTGREYVGCSDNIKKRWIHEHFTRPFSRSKKKRNYIRLLYADIRKHGLENFKFEVIYRCKPEQQNKDALFELEKFFVFQRGTYNPAEANPNGGYNLTRGGAGVLGVKWTAEAILKQSAANKGEKNPNFGKKHSKETRAKLSAANTGRKMSKETRAKISAANTGKKRPYQFKKVLGKRKHESDDKYIKFDTFGLAAEHFKCHRKTVSGIANKKYGSRKFDFKFVLE